MSEVSIVNARANVMVYDEQQKKWLPSGNSPGMAKVQVYHHTVNNTYRVVGRKINDHAVVINCALLKGLRYHVATERFHQWRDQRQVYGLNFASSAEAEEFGNVVRDCLAKLSGGVSPAADTAAAQRAQEEERARQEEERIRQEEERRKAAEEEKRKEEERLALERAQEEERQRQMAPALPASAPPVPRAPAAPPAAPPAPAAPAAPRAPPAPAAPPAPPAPKAPPAPAAPPAPKAPPAPRAPPAPGAPPAPPAPGAPAAPRPAAGGGGGGMGDLASQLAGATLKSAKTNNRPAPKPALSLQDEMRLKLERRKAKLADDGGTGGGSGTVTPASSDKKETNIVDFKSALKSSKSSQNSPRDQDKEETVFDFKKTLKPSKTSLKKHDEQNYNHESPMNDEPNHPQDQTIEKVNSKVMGFIKALRPTKSPPKTEDDPKLSPKSTSQESQITDTLTDTTKNTSQRSLKETASLFEGKNKHSPRSVADGSTPSSPSPKPKWKQDLEKKNNGGSNTLTWSQKQKQKESLQNGTSDNASSGEVLDAIEKMKEELMNAFKEEISSLKNEVKELKEQLANR